MTLYLQLLSKIRRQSTINRRRFFLITFTSLFVFLSGSILLDMYMPTNYIWNTVRAVLSICIAIILMALYSAFDKPNRTGLLNIKYHYEKLSLEQRINVTTTLSLICLLLFLMLVPVRFFLYTVLAGVLLWFILLLVYYCKPTYDEVVNQSLGLDDIRDTVHDYKQKRKG